MLRALARDSVLYSIPSLVSRGIGFLLVPLYTRVLSPADFGSLDLLLVFANLVNLTIALEVSQGIARFYGAEKDAAKKAAYAASAWWFTFGVYSLFAVAAAANVRWLSPVVLGRAGLEDVFLIGVVYIWCLGLYQLAVNQFRWDLRGRQYATTSIVMTVVTAISTITLVYGLRLGLAGLLAGMAIGAAVGTGHALARLRGTLPTRAIKLDALGELLRFSAPLVPASIAIFLGTYVDRIMINALTDISSVGLYGVGFRIASVVGLVMVGFQGALTPLLYVHHSDSSTPIDLAKLFRWFVALAILGVSALAMFAKEITTLFATEVFAGAWVVVAPLALSHLFAQMYVFAPGIAIEKRTQLLVFISVGGAIINAGLNALLIPFFGIAGAAAATLAGNAIAFWAHMGFSQNLYPVPHAWTSLAKAAAICVFTTAVVLGLPVSGALAFTTALLGLVVISATLLHVGLVHPHEVCTGFNALVRATRSALLAKRRDRNGR